MALIVSDFKYVLKGGLKDFVFHIWFNGLF